MGRVLELSAELVCRYCCYKSFVKIHLFKLFFQPRNLLVNGCCLRFIASLPPCIAKLLEEAYEKDRSYRAVDQELTQKRFELQQLSAVNYPDSPVSWQSCFPAGSILQAAPHMVLTLLLLPILLL